MKRGVGRKRAIISVSIVSMLIGCASIHAKKSKDVGIIGINIGLEEIKAGENLDGVLFLRLNDPNDIKAGGKVFYSEHKSADLNFYLFNAEPGTYVVIGTSKVYVYSSSFSRSSTYFLTYSVFPQKAIEQTKIKVSGDKIAFMGSFKVKLAGLVKNTGDELQKYFKKAVFKRPMFNDPPKVIYNYYVVKVEKTPVARKKFLKESSEYLEPTDWKDFLH